VWRVVCVGISILTVSVLVVYWYEWRVPAPVAPENERVGVLPEVTLPDVHGIPVTLSSVQADVRVVNFWASWSPYSRDELPALARIKKKFGDRVAVLAVNRDTNPNDGKAFYSSLGLGDDVVAVFDQADTYFKEVGGYNMPETLFVDREGGILLHTHGPMTEKEIDEALTVLLKA